MPLAGRRVLVTRARAQSARLAAALEHLGADVDCFAAIEIVPPPSWQSLDELIVQLESFDRIFFTSTNGVEALFARAAKLKRPANLRGNRVAAVGRATADALIRHGVTPGLVPEKFESAELLPLLAADQRGVRSAIVRAIEGREVLVNELRARGGDVHVATAYRTHKATAMPVVLRARLVGGAVDVVTFTSPSTVEGTLSHFPQSELAELFAWCTIVSIGPVTTKALARAGAPRVVEAKEASVEGLVAAVVAHLTKR